MGLWQDIVTTGKNIREGYPNLSGAPKFKDIIGGEFNSMNGVKKFIEKLNEQVELNTKLQGGSQSYEGAKEEYKYKSDAYTAVAKALSAKIAKPEFQYPTSILTATEAFRVIHQTLTNLENHTEKPYTKKEIMSLAKRNIRVDKDLSDVGECSFNR